MILAGDIGGTKTNLGLFDVADGALTLRHEDSYSSKNYSGLESIIEEFMSDARRSEEHTSELQSPCNLVCRLLLEKKKKKKKRSLDRLHSVIRDSVICL